VAVIPLDHAGVQRAIAEQRPAVMDRSSRAGRALLTLAETLNEGKLSVPLADDVRRTWWRRLLGRASSPVVTRRLARADVATLHSASGTTRSRS
jgi:hypothetical protein